VAPSQDPQPGDVRDNPAGDIEVYTGQEWTAVGSVGSEPGPSGSRGDPLAPDGSRASADPADPAGDGVERRAAD
jgi:hypothetical protein